MPPTQTTAPRMCRARARAVMSGAPVRGTKEVIIAVGTTVWTGRALQARCDHLEVMVLLEERDPHVNACGSSDTADHAVCKDQERGAARSSVTTSRARALGRSEEHTSELQSP